MRLFVPKCTDDDIAVLRTIIRDFRRAAQQPRVDVDKLAELACSFHRYICFKSGNNVVPLIVNGFHDVNIVLWAQWVRSVGPRAAGDVLEDFLYFVTQGTPMAPSHSSIRIRTNSSPGSWTCEAGGRLFSLFSQIPPFHPGGFILQ